MCYNLLDEEWIPILCRDGQLEHVGIRRAFEEASRIRQIAASNPMDRVAILRFLLALLYWCTEGLSDRAIPGDSLPRDWLKKLDENRNCFNLLGDGQRFYQERSTPSNERPIGDLLVEFPTETKIAHLRHVRDREYGLCPACCAVGIIRFCTWANAYGKGRYTSAVNGPTPAYAVPHGSTLLQTLIMNWAPGQASQRQPPWLNEEAPGNVSDLDLVTVLAWRSRRLWLGDTGSSDAVCAYCGQSSKLIKQMAFTGNWKPPTETKDQEKKFWDKDPHLLLVGGRRDAKTDQDSSETESGQSPSQAGRRAEAAAKKTTLGFPPPRSEVATHARFWRRASHAIVPHREAAGDDVAKAVAVVGPAANKGLYQDAAALCCICPLAGDATALLDALEKAVSSTPSVLKRSTPNPKRDHRNRTAALDALSPSLEARLRAEFEANPEGLATPEGLSTQLWPVVEQAVSASTSGSPLRRREALDRAWRELDGEMRRAVKSVKQPAAPDDAG